MIHRLTFILALFASGCAQTSAVKTGENYSWVDDPDYAALRQKIGWDDEFDSLCEDSRPLPAMTGAMNEKQWEKAVKLGIDWLHRCPIDIRVHYYTAIALEELGEKGHADDHFRWTKGLMDSIVASGDGKTCKTAYVTISTAEEYDALYLFGLKVKEQALVANCDLMTATNEQDEEISIYFNPSAHFARLSKIFK
jgi:hypothetical protein